MELPLSRLTIGFRGVAGDDEAMLVDLSIERPARAGITVLERLAFRTDGAVFDAGALTLTDFEAALVGLRCATSGATAASTTRCADCGEQVEIGFAFDALAAAALPRAVASIARDGEGWSFEGTRFRLPCAADVAVHEGQRSAAPAMLAACVDTAPGAPILRRIERAMERLAPLLSRIVAAPCPACGVTLRALIHVPTFVVGEMVAGARGLFEDVDLIASAYGWREADILALPRTRRRRYAAGLLGSR